MSFIAYVYSLFHVYSLFQTSHSRYRNLSKIQMLIFLRFATSFRVSPFAKTHATDSTRNMTRKRLMSPFFLPSSESFRSDLSCIKLICVSVTISLLTRRRHACGYSCMLVNIELHGEMCKLTNTHEERERVGGCERTYQTHIKHMF